MFEGAKQDAQEAQLSHSQGFLSQAARSIAMRVSAAGLTFGMALVVARALGDRGLFGEYSLAIFWMNILAIVAKLGFDTASLRFIAQYRAGGEDALVRGYDVTARRWTLGMSLIMSAAMLVGTLLLRSMLSEGVFWCLMIASALLPVIVGIQLREAGLLAFGRVMFGQTSGVLTPLILIALVLALPLLTRQRLSPPLVVGLHLVSALVTLTFVGWMSRRTFADVKEVEQPEIRTREWLHVAVPILLVQFLNLVQHQSGIGLCGALLDKEAAGLFSAVVRVAGVLFLGLQAINMIAAPTIASLYHSGRQAELESFVKTCSLASGGFAFAFMLVMILFGRTVLGIFGDQYVEGFVPMMVMIAGLSLAAAAGPVTQFLLMTGQQWECIKIFSVNVIVCLAAAIVVIPTYGVLGAAGIAAFARLSSSASMVLLIKRKHNLWCVAGWPTRSVTTPLRTAEPATPQRVAA